MTDQPFGTVNGDGMRYLLLRDLDSVGWPLFGVLMETADGGATLHVFGGSAKDYRLADAYPDFDAAVTAVARKGLVSAAGREGDEHHVGARNLDPPQTSRLESDWIGKPVEAGRQSMTEIALDTRVKLLRAELVADHWRKAYLEWGDDEMPARMFAHGMCCVLAALQGVTSAPSELGVTVESPEGQHLTGLSENE